MTEKETDVQRQVPPIIKIGLVIAGAVGVWMAVGPSCEAERPALTDITVPTEATTTTTEAPAAPPYYEKYGWDRDYAREDARANLYDALELGKAVKVAAGRCIVTKFTNGDKEEDMYWRVIKNPIVTEGEHGGFKFTTFTGYNPNGGFDYTSETVTVIDGEVYWGNFGYIPGQTEMVDTTRQIIGVDKESDLYVPGELLIIPGYDRASVAKNCISPDSHVEDLPKSKR